MAVAVTPEQQFLDDLMTDAISDSVGLWVVARFADEAFRDLPPDARRSLAQRTVRTLLQRGWVQLYERKASEDVQPETLVEPTRVEDALSDETVWDPDHIMESPIQYLILATERGDHEFHDDLRRRGLYR